MGGREDGGLCNALLEGHEGTVTCLVASSNGIRVSGLNIILKGAHIPYMLAVSCWRCM